MRSDDFTMPVTQLLTVRNILRSVRTPLLIAISLAQPAVWLILFSQTFRALGDTAQFRALGYSSYLSFFLPGMVVLSMLFTALQSGMATMSDIDTGMLDKLLTAPIGRWSILAARVLADAVVMAVQAILLIALGVALGARLRAGWPGWLLFGVLAVAFGVVWASVSNLIALRTRNSEVTMVAGFFVTLPVLFLSAAFFPRPLLPGWLQAVTMINPASQVIETGQRLVSGGAMLTQDLRALLALAVTAAVFMPLTVTAFRAR
jgi:ABC-2 type transport system permease protein